MSDFGQEVGDNLSGVVTVGQAIQILADAFRSAKLDAPQRDAQILVQHAAQLTREACVANPNTILTPLHCARTREFLKRRLAREPVSRILGHRYFYGRKFLISPATLDPRPDTETIVISVLEYVKKFDLHAAPLRIIDVGTGSGILILTLLAELPNATGVGTDLSVKALAVAQQNAMAHGVAERVRFLQLDGVENINETFDLLVSNPPYIATHVMRELAAEVSAFDPALALDGGPDGLSFYRRLAPHVLRLIPDGLAVVEVGYDQSDAVVDILNEQVKRHGPVQIWVKKDLAGHQRCVALQTHY